VSHLTRSTFGLTLVALSTLAFAVPPDAAPPRRAHHALVYDAGREVVLLTAGSTPIEGGNRFRFFNDVWSFDGRSWRLLGESGVKLSGVGLAYDSKRARVVSLGGYTGRPLDALRAWDGSEWNDLENHPEGAAAEAGLAYDAARDRLVAFGGSVAQGRFGGTTWEHDGAAWTKVDAPVSPPARQAHAMAYDSARRRTVIFGGSGEPPPGGRRPKLGDTWEYDGRTWTRRDVEGPSPRLAMGAAFDSKRGRLILFGGLGESGFLGDTWSWDGTAWKRLAETGPEARAMGALAYDAKRDRIVLFGGRKGFPDGDLDDTWEFDGAAWRRFEAKE
jgi:hypothetical protein